MLGLTTTRRRDARLARTLADLTATKRQLAEANVALVMAAGDALTAAARHERERQALLRRLGVALNGCRRYRREARADARIIHLLSGYLLDALSHSQTDPGATT
ncbi:hypothetical protein [Streptomyces sp. H39-S7]|uniref:hypothetical protein n=1 Tax=Streptomyces sp. H39-S7 TaxID=3004357 RepID=UPI0022AFB2EC|nr:hypothetical protein [Streptomyces sp. H39-S7]MCZ4123372.1 hypothetical protein [Streptomyces sp. H39-S7]